MLESFPAVQISVINSYRILICCFCRIELKYCSKVITYMRHVMREQLLTFNLLNYGRI